MQRPWGRGMGLAGGNPWSLVGKSSTETGLKGVLDLQTWDSAEHMKGAGPFPEINQKPRGQADGAEAMLLGF